MLQEFKRPKYDENLSSSVSEELVKIFEKRRTIRQYSNEKPDREIILNAIRVASLAPSGANAQPWHFAVIENQALKEEIKDKCEKEEFDFYHKNPNQKWIEDLKHLHT
ncbi:MAG: nitroreductase family protein, partial [Halobacteriovoraceae bacterium]|nr:nitroreductase family protein [Halobacteriovoraceae bacterium]